MSELTDRGSTHAWRKRRERWQHRLPQPCSRCGEPVQPWHDWHLDHVIPRSRGGSDRDTRPAHALCNRAPAVGEGAFFSEAPAAAMTGLSDRSLSETHVPEQKAPDASDAVWDRCDWLENLRTVPDNARWPRLMTGPHPDAVGSYGGEAIAWAGDRLGMRLRWWQELVWTRALEHDGDGALVWLDVLVSTARQLGKSVGLRGVAAWRIHQAERFGEPQLVLHTGKDLPVCNQVQAPVRTWARRLPGYRVRELNGSKEVTTPDESSWLVRGRGSVYSYSASMAVADETWGIAAGVIEDGIEPTMAERASAQLWLLSTAHRKTTSLMPNRLAAAAKQIRAPHSSLLLQWSAPSSAPIDDREAWRDASPHWTRNRERLLEAKLERARSGVSDDPDDDDPIESFRSQFLNVWPAPEQRAAAATTQAERLVSPEAWSALSDLTMPAPPSLVVAVEDWLGLGAAGAAAGYLGDGRVIVFGGLHGSRAAALQWALFLCERAGTQLLIGKSLSGDAQLPAELEPQVCGRVETSAGLSLLRELVRDKRIVHDGGSDLATQVGGAWVLPSADGLRLQAAKSGRVDLLRSAVWAVGALTRQPERAAPRPVIF